MSKSPDPYDLLDALNAVDEAQLEDTQAFFEERKETKPVKTTRSMLHIGLIAAALVLLLSATAYAAGLFTVSGRPVEPEESFPVSFDTVDGDKIEGAWSGTYALEFDGPEESTAVRYRFGWLPEGYSMPDYVYSQPDGEGWVKSTGAEGPYLAPWNAHTEFSGPDRHHYFITDMYYSAQFVPDGALILMSAEVGDVTEEQWGELEVRRIASTSEFLELDEKSGKPLRDKNGDFVVGELPCSYLVVFHPEQGWIFCVRGTLPPEGLEKIARNIEVEPTGETVHHEDFQNPYAFFDAARG